MSDRGIFHLGLGGAKESIDYITISTTGNALDFGDLTFGRRYDGSCSNGKNDRGIFGGGAGGAIPTGEIIDYVTISTTGNATDFGDLTLARQSISGTSNDINEHGIFGGGKDSTSGIIIDIIDYITINSTGNAIDFGDLLADIMATGACSNGKNDRGVFGGGISGYTDVIQYVTISTTGNTTDFGDLTHARAHIAGTSSGIRERGIFGGGFDGSLYNNIIDYITINSTGNAIDFGNLTTSRAELSGTSNGMKERGIFAGGLNTVVNSVNIIDYVTISTPGNTTDFGDLTRIAYGGSATSNAENVFGKRWQAGVDINNMQYMMTIDRDSTSVNIFSLEADGMLIPEFIATVGDRGIWAGGKLGTGTISDDTIDYVTISTTGNATDFGDVTTNGARRPYGCSNGVTGRGVYAKGYEEVTGFTTKIDYITILSPGNATDFGDTTFARLGGCSMSNNINDRGTFAVGNQGAGSYIIDYVTISSIGNATDFGDAINNTTYPPACSNATNERGVWADSGDGITTEYITINSTGNATSFGSISTVKYASNAGCSNGTNERGLLARGNTLNAIRYITINSTGNAIDFGDFLGTRVYNGACSNMTNERGVFAGGGTSTSTYIDVIEYLTINSLGNSTDFGDLTFARQNATSFSNT